MLLNYVGNLLASRGKYEEAEGYLKKSLSISEEISSLSNIQEAEKSLSELYDKTGRTSLAFKHFKNFILAGDSLKKEENAKAMFQVETKYEQNKKDLIAEQEKQLRANKEFWIKIIAIIVFLSLITIAFVQYKRYKSKKQTSEELANKNKIIVEKNKDITDSITYAKRIQQAKLPDKNEINKSLPQSFVLFKPKDIVSGDFYYFYKNDKAVFIASADCTGHGVPGAFMSMIGFEKLDDALAYSADTSEILSHLNKGIKTSLKQSDSDESTRDGMDIAICAIDTNACIVKYAGANRPLWIIRKGKTIVEEIKATKKAIGGFTEESQHYETHEIKLQQGDSFYISTDGYADTFSGSDGKKLTTKKFKEILLSIQDKSMKDQEEHLDNFIENWKAGTEQVDDILVIGVRL